LARSLSALVFFGLLLFVADAQAGARLYRPMGSACTCCEESEPPHSEFRELTLAEGVPTDEELHTFEPLKTKIVSDEAAPEKQRVDKLEISLPCGEVPACLENEELDTPTACTATQETAELDRGESPSSRSSLVAFESRAQDIRDLCRVVRTIDAHEALQSLESDIAEDAKNIQDVETKAAFDALSKRLQSDPLLCQMRRVHSRLKKAMQLMDLAPNNQKGDESRWAKYSQSLPEIHPSCRLEIHGRFLEEHEKNKSAGSTQFMIMVRIYNLPITMNQNFAIYSQMDLYQTRWDPKTKDIKGWQGGEEKLHSVLYTKLSPGPLPFTSDSEIASMRDFSICARSPLPGFKPGVLVVSNPLDCLEAAEGWEIPPLKPGAPRSAVCGLDYLEHGDHPTTSHLMFVMSRDVPIPQWMIPINTGIKLISGMAVNSIKSMNSLCWEHWNDTGLDERMATLPELVAAVSGLSRTVEAEA